MNWRRVVLVVVMSLPVGCGGGLSQQPDGGGGAGGTTGIAGTTGSAGAPGVAGTTGTGGVAGQSVPSCLQELMAACPTDTCVGSGPVGDAGSAQCFASGARSQSEPSQTCPNAPTRLDLNTLVTVTKADGSLCYTVDHCCMDIHACEYMGFTWKDAAGDVVATGASDAEGYRVTCAATGEAVRLPFTGSGLFGGACPSGAVCP